VTRVIVVVDVVADGLACSGGLGIVAIGCAVGIGGLDKRC
jgi:hypothetical protein